ncbi:MAG: triose-phosphate isomerase [Sulfurospirillaceae bacterium]|nr:triose-phosphate isomerase [Sulfurospirillaceae bacterium]
MIIASNFKTTHTRASTRAFVQSIVDMMAQTNSKQEVRIYPPFTALDTFCCNSSIKIGVQNFYPADRGSFTGEIGFEQLGEFGVDSVLIGHSERRHILKESVEFIAQKFDFAKQKGVEIIYCVGEPKEVREQGIDAVMSYIWEQFDGIDTSYDRLVVAYEPVWAIGTGLTAKKEDIEEVLLCLRTKLSCELLYGGSVKTDNIEEILLAKECGGVLVGTASWDADAFSAMIRSADTCKK